MTLLCRATDVICSSFIMNALSISSRTDSMAESTLLSSPAAVIVVVNKFNPGALWWRGWLRYCCSPVNHRKPDLIGPNRSCSGIIAPQWRNARPNFQTMLWAGLPLAPRLWVSANMHWYRTVHCAKCFTTNTIKHRCQTQGPRAKYGHLCGPLEALHSICGPKYYFVKSNQCFFE